MKALIFAIVAAANLASAAVKVEVLFEPLPAEFQSMQPVVRSHITAAAQAWVGCFEARDCTLRVLFAIHPGRIGGGHSLVSQPYLGEQRDRKHVIEEGAAQKLRTGRHTNFFFHGPHALKLYGRPVLLAHTNNNYHHVAEQDDQSDPKLAEDLMNGVTFDWGKRYYIGPLDVAILSDCGLTPKK